MTVQDQRRDAAIPSGTPRASAPVTLPDAPTPPAVRDAAEQHNRIADPRRRAARLHRRLGARRRRGAPNATVQAQLRLPTRR